MKGLIIAVQFLTRLPTPRLTASREDFAASIRWFPAVGLIVGGVVAGGGWIGARIDPWTGALAALALWVWVTGALHLDGLGDLADARGAAHKPGDRLQAVLADPHIGSFAAVAIALQLIAKLVLLHGLLAAQAYAAMALTAFAARIGPLVWARWLPPLHAGLGSTFRDAALPRDIAAWTLALAAAAWASPSLIAAPLLLVGWGWRLHRSFGGISGDGHGAGIETTETLLLLTALIWAHMT